MEHGADVTERDMIVRVQPWRRRLLIVLRSLFAVALLATLIMTLRPHHAPIVGNLFWWKLGDCSAFAVLTLISIIAFPNVRLFRLGEYLSFLAAVVEVGQGLLTVGRDANILDWLIETVVIAMILLLSSPPRAIRHQPRSRGARDE
jgi:hypothetical protein